LFLATELSALQRGHEQCRNEATAVGGWSTVKYCLFGPGIFAADLSPEDNDAPEVGWFATSLCRTGLAIFHDERNAAFLDNQMISN
jgi:hypothetical protein